MSYIAGDAIKARRTTKSASWKRTNLGQSTVSASYHPVVPPTITSYGYRPAKKEGPRYTTEIESGRVTSTYYNYPTTRYVSSVREGVPRSATAPRRHRQPYVQSYVNVNGVPGLETSERSDLYPRLPLVQSYYSPFSTIYKPFVAKCLEQRQRETDEWLNCCNVSAGVVPVQRELRCPYCSEYFEDPSQHFLAAHQLRIKDINSILDIQRYLNFWKDKAPTIQELQKSSQKNGDLFELANQDGDGEIRKQVRLAIIHDLVEDQQREREDPTFERQCLFCATKFQGNRRELFQHMFQTHHFNIGSPENMVHINELLDILQEKLENLQCIYCEKIFKDQRMLKEHIRKKKHLKINSKNKFYDRFYLVNYLEADKTWQDLRQEIDQIDDVASHSSTTGDEDDDPNEDLEWGDWTSEESEESTCLFCATKASNISAAFEHLKTTHQFDILDMKANWKLDFYSCIKLINYTRKQMTDKCCIYCHAHFETVEVLRQHLEDERHCKVNRDASFWNDPQYLIPADESDGLLVNFPMFDDDDE